jgi:hypothetical protein
MNKFMIATTTAVALIAGVGAASAQSMQNDGASGYRGRMMIDRNVGLQTAPSDDGMYAEQGRSRGWMRQRDGSTFESRSFRSQEVWPQSPPTGS